jgi:hypothetical protein
MPTIFYTRCSKCKIDKYTNPIAYAKRKEELKGKEEKVDDKDSFILMGTNYVCRDCKKLTK